MKVPRLGRETGASSYGGNDGGLCPIHIEGGRGMLWECSWRVDGINSGRRASSNSLGFRKIKLGQFCHSFLSSIKYSCLLYLGNKNVNQQKKWWGWGHCALALEGQDWPEAPDQGPGRTMNPAGSRGDPTACGSLAPESRRPAAEGGPDIWILTQTQACSYRRFISGPDVSARQLACPPGPCPCLGGMCHRREGSRL